MDPLGVEAQEVALSARLCCLRGHSNKLRVLGFLGCHIKPGRPHQHAQGALLVTLVLEGALSQQKRYIGPAGDVR